MNAAFDVVFALFVVAMVGLGFTAVRWAVRRDRAARMATGPTGATGPDVPGPGGRPPERSAP